MLQSMIVTGFVSIVICLLLTGASPAECPNAAVKALLNPQKSKNHLETIHIS